MKRTFINKLILNIFIASIMSFPFPLLAKTTEKNDDNNIKQVEKENRPFFQDGQRGWFWYEKPKPKVVKKKKEEKIKKAQIQKPKIDWDKVWELHPKEFKELMDQVRDYAMYKPTQENVYNYLKLQKIAIERSNRFVNVAGYVAMMHPELTYDTLPETRAEATREAVERLNRRREEVRRLSERYGIVFFYSPTCKYCKAEVPVLQALAEKYNFDIRSVNIKSNPELMVRFNIRVTPTLILVDKKNPKKYIYISEGFASLAKLLELIPKGAKILEGKLKPEDFFKSDYELTIEKLSKNK